MIRPKRSANISIWLKLITKECTKLILTSPKGEKNCITLVDEFSPTSTVEPIKANTLPSWFHLHLVMNIPVSNIIGSEIFSHHGKKLFTSNF